MKSRVYFSLAAMTFLFLSGSSGLDRTQIFSLAYLKAFLIWLVPILQIIVYYKNKDHKIRRDFLITLVGVLSSQLINRFMNFDLGGKALILDLIVWIPPFTPWILQLIDHLLDKE